jgi:chemotaxis protein CheD
MVTVPEIRIQPGELYLARGPAILQTILGSCVSATFWIPRLATGALCHGVLPLCPPGAIAPEGYRYVDFSIRYLAGQIDNLGVAREELQVKLFGGADVLAVSSARAGKPTVGALNCQAALQILKQEGLAVMASDLGGARGRSIRFHTGTGEVLVRRLAPWSASDSHEQ